MPACELCWAEAYRRMMLRGGSQAEHYRDLLEENPMHSRPTASAVIVDDEPAPFGPE